MKDLGTITQLLPRAVWPHEAADFTPWLALPENLARLSEAVGLDLEIESTEVAVGPYSADIVARETSSGQFVVIENQLEKTDHDHLGKVLTYASALDARYVIWIATHFTEEHEGALQWLNRHTGEELSFYGVRLEVWQIDSSRPAVNFAVHARPAIVRQASIQRGATGEISDVRKLQLELWQELRESLKATGKISSLQSPRPQSWYVITLGRSVAHLSCFADTWGKRVGVRVYLSGRSGGVSALEQLRADCGPIEAELGFPLIWDPSPEKSDRTLVAEKPIDLESRANRDEAIRWLTDTAIGMRDVFAPRVRALRLEAAVDAEVAD